MSLSNILAAYFSLGPLKAHVSYISHAYVIRSQYFTNGFNHADHVYLIGSIQSSKHKPQMKH